MSKIKILWVVYDFVQAGGQRYVYEISKTINRDRFEFDFLKVSPLGDDKNWNNEHYYELTKELGFNIYQLHDIIGTKKNTFANKLESKIKRHLKLQVDKKEESIKIKRFFESYKYVNFSGTSVYENICINRNISISNALIHILTAKFQGIDIYKGYDKDKFYNFISALEPEILEYELSEFKHYKHTFFPLSLSELSFTVERNKNKPTKIAVFTRLSQMKPIDVYFYALKNLIENGFHEVNLHIYGAGDPVALGLTRQLEYLYLTHKVFFKGHTDSIQQTLQEEHIDLVWYQAANGKPAGYAALEIALGGVPQVLWDFNRLNPEIDNDYCFKSFINLNEFVSYSKELLLCRDKLNALGLEQQKYVLDEHSIDKNIEILERKYDS